MAKTSLAKAYVQIVPSADGIKGSIANVLGDESQSAGKKAGTTIASSIKKIIVGAGIGKALSSALMEGANLQQSIGGIETLFKGSANQMQKYAEEAYKTAGISANSYMEQATSFSASLLQSLGGDTEKAAEAANQAIIDMADNSNKMGTSLEMIQNAYQGFAKQNFTMLDNLKLGYGGTKTEMERLLKDAQKISGIKYDISNLDDIYSAIHIIQEEMGITGTTSKEASETFSGSFASMKAAASNFIGYLTLGKDIKPALKGLIDSTGVFLFKNLIPMVGNIVASLPSVIATVISEGIPTILEEGKRLLGSLTMAIRNEFPKLIESGTESITNFITGLMNNLPYLLFTGGNLLINLVNAIIEKMPLILDSAYKIISTIVSGLIRNLPQIIKTGVELIVKLAAGLIKGVPKVLEKATEIYRKVKDKFKTLDWFGIGKNIIMGILKGLKNSVGSLVSAAKDAAKSALNSVKNFLGIHSPSRVFETQVGKMISLGLAEGIQNNTDEVIGSMKKLGQTTVDVANNDAASFRKGATSATVQTGLDGVTIVFHQVTELDSKPLCEKTSQYTLRKLGNKYEAVLKGSGR